MALSKKVKDQIDIAGGVKGLGDRLDSDINVTINIESGDLENLNNVSIINPINGHLLTYTGSGWANQALSIPNPISANPQQFTGEVQIKRSGGTGTLVASMGDNTLTSRVAVIKNFAGFGLRFYQSTGGTEYGSILSDGAGGMSIGSSQSILFQAFTDGVKFASSIVLNNVNKAIGSGAITVGPDQAPRVILSISGDTGDLDTINGGVAGYRVTLQAGSGQTITIKHSTGNIVLFGGVDIVLGSGDWIDLMYDDINSVFKNQGS